MGLGTGRKKVQSLKNKSEIAHNFFETTTDLKTIFLKSP